MDQLTGNYIDAGVHLAAGLLCIYLYKSEKTKGFVKTKWFLALAMIMILGGPYKIYNAHRKAEAAEAEVEKQERALKELTEIEATVAISDAVVTTRGGLTVLVPAGYRYQEVDEGMPLFRAYKEADENIESSFIMTTEKSGSSLLSQYSKAVKSYSAGNSTFVFEREDKIQIDSRPAYLADLKANIRGNPYSGKYLLIKDDNHFHSVLMLSRERFYPSESKVFTRVIESIEFE